MGDVTMHHFHVGCSDDGTEFNVDLSDADAAAVASFIAAYEAATPPPEDYSGPWFVVDDPERCYRKQTYGNKDGRWQVVETADLPESPACREWWLARRDVTRRTSDVPRPDAVT